MATLGLIRVRGCKGGGVASKKSLGPEDLPIVTATSEQDDREEWSIKQAMLTERFAMLLHEAYCKGREHGFNQARRAYAKVKGNE